MKTSSLPLLGLASMIGLLIGGCYGKQVLREPVTIDEIASDVQEIKEDQAGVRESMADLELEVSQQAQAIQNLKTENEYLIHELEDRLLAIDSKLQDVIGRTTGFSGDRPYWSGAAPDSRGDERPQSPFADVPVDDRYDDDRYDNDGYDNDGYDSDRYDNDGYDGRRSEDDRYDDRPDADDGYRDDRDDRRNDRSPDSGRDTGSQAATDGDDDRGYDREIRTDGDGDSRGQSGNDGRAGSGQDRADPDFGYADPDASAREIQAKRVYDQAYLDLSRGNYSLAILGFSEFLRRAPESRLADNAQYWIGECYYAQSDFRQAALEFKKVLDDHPREDKVPSALLKIGFCSIELGDRPAARQYLSEVADAYPNTEESRLARDRLRSLE